MEFLVVFFAVFFVLVFVVGPLVGPDDRTGFRRPERKARAMVGDWFLTDRCDAAPGEARRVHRYASALPCAGTS